MEKDLIIVLDFGGQYNQLIARRVRECSVYCEVHPYTISLEELKAKNPKGIILTGGPNSVFDPASPHYDPALFDQGIPILGICYGYSDPRHLLRRPAHGLEHRRHRGNGTGQRIRKD